MKHNWDAHLLVWRLLSPLHAGAGKVSNLQRTRLYVPARSVWAALTARLARGGDQNYPAAGARVSESLRPTCLFPALSETDAGQHGRPVQGIGSYRLFPPPWRDDYGYLFLDGYVSTPVNPDSGGAVDGGLHEVEYIRPRTRSFGGKRFGAPVFMIGYLLVRSDADVPWRSFLADFQVGGERRYGWGRLRLVAPPETGTRVFGASVGDQARWPPTLSHASDSTLFGQLQASNADGVLAQAYVKGHVEPNVGRDTVTGHFGGKVTNLGACWAPGAHTAGALDVTVTEQGQWQTGFPSASGASHGG